MDKLYPKYNPGTYHSRELYRTVYETKDLRPVWAYKNAQKWGVDYTLFLKLCGETCSCCGSVLDYGLGKNNNKKLDINTPSTDHIIPRSLDESKTNDITNLWIICNRCNILKNNSTADDIHRYRSILSVLEKINKTNI
jgi:5-methylcytosine-specific restriction endonuclease McrA